MQAALPNIDTVSRWDIIFLNPASDAFWAGLLVLIAVTTLLLIRKYLFGPGSISTVTRWFLALLRLTAIAAAILFALLPALQFEQGERVKQRIAVIIDRSESMAIARHGAGQNDIHTTTPYAQVLAAIDASTRLQTLQDEGIVQWFDLRGKRIDPTEIQAAPKGQHSDLWSAIRTVMRNQNAQAAKKGDQKPGAQTESAPSNPLAAIVLFTDGVDRGDLKYQSELDSELTVPITIVQPPSVDLKDAAILSILTDEFAFIHNTLEIDVEIAAQNLDLEQARVTLSQNGAPLATQRITLDAGQRATLRFATKPNRLGDVIYQVQLEASAEEQVLENNQVAKIVQVVRDKMRVLHVAGRPSWDERFLRQHLKQNPNVDLVAFFILRTLHDVQQVPKEELSLIYFPTQTLFEEKIDSFDIIIFQNFDYRDYDMARYLPSIRSAIEKGVGFAMIGTADAFGPAYQGTPLETALPVQVAQNAEPFQTGPVQLTPEGDAHPITNLRNLGFEHSNRVLWSKLPPVRQGGPAGQAAADSLVLLKQTHAGAEEPLVAIKSVGDGRVMAVTTDQLWRWRFANHSNRLLAERIYHRFWANALRWLAKDAQQEHLTIEVTPQHSIQSESRTLRLSAQTPDFRPHANASFVIQINGPHLEKAMHINARTDRQGQWQQTLNELPAGVYTASVQHEGSENPSATFIVESHSLEFTDLIPKQAALQWLATQSGGELKALSSSDPFASLKRKEPEMVRYAHRTFYEVWDTPWLLLLICLCLSLEWWLRRRLGWV